MNGWTGWVVERDDLRNSPSRKDGMSEKEERRQRRKTCIFLEDLGEKLLRVDWQTHATAQIYMHFFFAHHSFLRRKRIYVALASMFLAAKVEECAAPYARRLSTVSQSVNTSVRPSVRPSVGCASS